jgi:hypothetical protein
MGRSGDPVFIDGADGDPRPEDLLAVYRDLPTGRAPTTTELASTRSQQLRRPPRARGGTPHRPDADDRVAWHRSRRSLLLGHGPRDTLVGGCAWDSFAFICFTTTGARVDDLPGLRSCARVGRRVRYAAGGQQVAHFLIPSRGCGRRRTPAATSACSVDGVFGAGLPRAPMRRLRHDRHPVAVGQPLVRGRLEPGYTRREPAAAAAYFQSVGLRGPFWGLDD